MKFLKKLRMNKTTLYIFLSFFLTLQTLSYIYVTIQENKAINFLEKKSENNFNEQVKFSSNYLTKLSQMLYDTVINTESMKNIMAAASQTKDKKTLAKLRKKLYEEDIASFNYMKTKFVRQLHFHLPGSISFLRFHRPNKFGDSLVGVRPTLEYVNEHRQFVHAFEEGRIFNGFRNVYPIFKGGSFVGTVEISYSFTAIQEMIQEVNNSSFLFLINNDIVTTKVFEEETNNYIKSEFEALSYDKKALIDQKELDLDQLHAINAQIASLVKEQLRKKESFSILFHNEEILGSRTLTINFLPIKNLYHKQVAYIINYEFDTIVDLVISRNKTLLISLTFLSLFISLLVSIMVQHFMHKEQSVYRIATHDTLTNIYNRYGLAEVMKQKVGEFQRFQRKLSVIFFDIDHFKSVNDTYGHDVGDEVLKKLTSIVSLNIRSSDIFARWGGEEFVIMLPETSLHDAIILAEKLREIIEEHDFTQPPTLTCSFGVTEIEEGEDEKALLKRADELLYRAKELGRNCVISDVKLK